MGPGKVSQELRRVSAAIDRSKHPSARAVAQRLRRLIAAVESDDEPDDGGMGHRDTPTQNVYPNLNRFDIMYELSSIIKPWNDEMEESFKIFSEEQLAKLLKSLGGPR